MTNKRNISYMCFNGRRPRLAVLVALIVLAWTGGALAAFVLPTVSPFDVTGFLEEATVNPGGVFSGGQLKVNGQVVIVPANTMVILPANMLSWEELFAQAPLPYTGLETGMALADSPPPMTTYEVHVVGNVVNGTYIAGLIDISQQALNSGQGFINFIDYTNHEIRVGGAIGSSTTGARVRLNDPLGKFAALDSPDPRFTVDEDNPTVRASTGFPMCLARVALPGIDPLCPETNRPKDAAGNYLIFFNFPDPAGVVPGGLDPRQQMPFEVGDWVTYAGTLVHDGSNPTAGPWPTASPPATGTDSTYISAHTMVANIGAYTAPGTMPAYVAIDVTILGTGGAGAAGAAEATTRTRFEGFSTDPSRAVEIFGVDVNCDGSTSDRAWAIQGVDQGAAAGGAVLGRWRFRPPNGKDQIASFAPFLPPTREVRAVVYDNATGTPAWVPGQNTTFANGIIAGQYHAPITEYLFPEAVVGSPPVPNNFETFPFLVNGGLIEPTTNSVSSQLSPFPAFPTPVSACAAVAGAPVANAGPNQTLTSAVPPNTLTVTLSGSSNPSAGATFAWTQVGGPAVTLNPSASVANPSFIAPDVAVGGGSVVLTFQLVVTVNGVSSQPATTIVTINPPTGVVADTVTITGVVYRANKSRLDVTATSSAQPPSGNAILTLKNFPGNPVKADILMVFDPTLAQYSVTVFGVPKPANGATFTVVSDHGGSATSPVTRFR